MLHILLLILKIIGIILLVVLGLVLVALVSVLFVPVRYQIVAKTQEGVEQLEVVAKGTWVLHLVSAFVSYKNKKLDWSVRIFGKKYSADHKKKKQLKKTVKSEATEPQRQHEKPHTKQNQETQPDEKIKKKTTSRIGKIKCTICKIYDKIKKIWVTKVKISNFLKDEIHQEAFRTIAHEVRYLTKHARPRKAKGFVRFGLDDPYRTGQVLAVLSMVYPFYGEQIHIYPEFEQKVLQGDISVKGYIRLSHFVKIIWTFIFDKNVRKTYEDYKSF